MPAWLSVANLFGALVFLVAGAKAFWDYGRLEASLALGAWLLVSILLAHRLGHLFTSKGEL